MPGSAGPSESESRRQTYRRQTIEAIKRVAIEQMTASGAGGISLNAIAGQLGMTGPALFRYVRSRDDLLTALILDAYVDLGDALWASVERTRAEPVRDRLRDHGFALREWALGNRARYLLLFGSPVPGYAAPADITGPAAARVLASTFALASGQADAGPPGADPPPGSGPAERALAAALQDWARANDLGDLSVAWLRQAILGWTRLHGVLTLELEGHFAFGLPDPALIFASEVEELARELDPTPPALTDQL